MQSKKMQIKWFSVCRSYKKPQIQIQTTVDIFEFFQMTPEPCRELSSQAEIAEEAAQNIKSPLHCK